VLRGDRAPRVDALAALVAATAVWASTFLVTKRSLEAMAPTSFLMWRFGVAALVLLVVGHRQVGALSGVERRRATCLGVFLSTGFLLQTTGLLTASAGLSGFLTGASVVLVPVVAWAAFGEQVPGSGWVAVALAGVGVTLLAGGISGGFSLGVVLTLAGAACFAGHIAGLSAWATRGNAVGLTVWSVAVAALLAGSAGLLGGELEMPVDRQAWAAVAYLALVATCLGFVVQAWAQSALSATTAAVVMTLEPVFAALIATALGGEVLSVLGWLGGLVVVAAMFVAEVGARNCCDAMSPRVECC
jgi:drug/metabolite transporter (DMT)-like permease